MNLQYYKPSVLEEWICKKYSDNGIRYANDLGIHRIAAIFNTDVRIIDGNTKAYWDDDCGLILIDGYLDEPRRRETFFHELCHPVKYVGNQHDMPESYKELQEIQANLFQLYAAMPAYMLDEFKNVSLDVYEKVIVEEFCFSPGFVRKRLSQIKGRIDQERRDQIFLNQHKVIIPDRAYSSETKRILDQLQERFDCHGFCLVVFPLFELRDQRRIVPELGNIEVVKLNAIGINAYYRKLLNEGLSADYINSIHSLLRSAFKKAKQWKIVQHDITDSR